MTYTNVQVLSKINIGGQDYYLKDAEARGLIEDLVENGVVVEVVESLPEASKETKGKIYLVGSSTSKALDAYVTINSGTNESPTYNWKKFGASIDWSGVENRPFNSTSSDDFTIEGTTDANKVLKINSTNWVSASKLTTELAKYLKLKDFTDSKIVSTLGTTPVNRAAADASGNNIATTYVKNTDIASATKLGIIKVGDGLAINSSTGVLSVDGDNVKVEWANVSGKPFSTVSSSDFVTSGDALAINSATWLSKAEAKTTYVAIEGFKTFYLDANNVAYKDDFDNYYKKSETYTQDEVNAKVNSEIKSQVLDKKGVASGFATLDANGTVPSSQLPSYVDDVLEFETLTKFPTTGETGKIYVALDTNLTYRWSGTQYVEISPSLALGETSSTAYQGDKGKQNADNIATLTTRVDAIEGKADTYVLKTTTVNGHALSSNVNVTKDDVGLGNVANTGDSATPVSNGTTKFTTGGAYTLQTTLQGNIDKKQDKLTAGNGIEISSDNKIAVKATTVENVAQGLSFTVDEQEQSLTISFNNVAISAVDTSTSK